MRKLLASCALLCLCNCVSTESVSAMNQQVQDYQQISQEQKMELFRAVKQNDTGRVRTMITQLHIDPNLQDERGATLIMVAFEHASLQTVTLLRALGAINRYDPYGLEPIKDNAGNTIAYYAILGGYEAFKFGHNNEGNRGYFAFEIPCCADGRKPEDVARELGKNDIVGYINEQNERIRAREEGDELYF